MVVSIENKKGNFGLIKKRKKFFEFGCPAYERQLFLGFTGIVIA
jgi:hypothetical protein